MLLAEYQSHGHGREETPTGVADVQYFPLT
jgi:hypothetical protein